MAKLRSRIIGWLLHRLSSEADAGGIDSVAFAELAQQRKQIEELTRTLRQRDQRHAKLKVRIKENYRRHQQRKKKVRVLEDEVYQLKQSEQRLQELVPQAQEQLEANLAHPGMAWELRDRKQALSSWLAGTLRRWVWKHSMRLGVLFQYEGKALVWDKLPKPKTTPDHWPVIAVVTPSFNQAEFIERTLKSVLDEAYPKLEYVVMDGGSTDGSQDIIARYADRLHHWQSGRDGGHSAAIADGFTKTRGEIMAWLNSDDVWAPGTLAFVGDYFARHPEVQAIYGHRVLIDAADRDVGRWTLPRHDVEFTKWADYIPQETLFWRRGCYEKAGGMDLSFRFSMDWDLILRLQKASPNMVRVPWVLGGFRVHAAQKSQTQIHTVAVEENTLLRKRELDTSFTEARLEERVILYQARAVLCNWLLRWGIRR
jgi:glycosyltransferase involved in cell wall biosynthesis